ncbi:MAG: hypothetical protein WC830_06465 [Burkholderiales bacterium]|jgi:hypothetical protein
MKPDIQLNLGRETSDEEVDEIVSAFSPYFEISYQRNILRLSADWLPLIIDFAVAAVGGGILYDALKGALITLREKFRAKKLARNPAAVVRVRNETYVVTAEKLFLQSIDVELHFNSVEEFVAYLRAKDKETSNN